MNEPPLEFHRGDGSRELDAFLADRIYEFNAQATGCEDGQSFAAAGRNEHGEIICGISGYTWARCCYIAYLWVHEAHRRRGLASALIRRVEDEARRLGCAVVIVSSHSFQAPGFYERMGYEVVATVANHPVGHANIVFSKVLAEDDA